MRTLTVDHNVLARTTIVLTHVVCLVVRELTVQCRTMLLYAGVPGALLGTPLETAEGSPEMRFVLLVGLTLTVRYVFLFVLF